MPGIGALSPTPLLSPLLPPLTSGAAAGRVRERLRRLLPSLCPRLLQSCPAPGAPRSPGRGGTAGQHCAGRAAHGRRGGIPRSFPGEGEGRTAPLCLLTVRVNLHPPRCYISASVGEISALRLRAATVPGLGWCRRSYVFRLINQKALN